MKMQSLKKEQLYPRKYYRDRRKFMKKLKININKIRNNSRKSSLGESVEVQDNLIEYLALGDDSEISNVLDGSDSSDDDELVPDVNNTEDIFLKSELQQWALNYKVNHNAVTSLLKILQNKVKYCLPTSSRTLLKTPRSISIDKIDGGFMWYHGIKQCLRQSILAKWQRNQTFKVNFNMDGLPIYKSTVAEFWPIFMNVADMPEIKPMVVAIFLGRGKPKSLEQYLRRFVIELNDTQMNGIVTANGSIVKVKLNSFIGDAPARAFIKGEGKFL